MVIQRVGLPMVTRAFLVIAAVALAACATPGIVPEPPYERYSLPTWPRGSITLEVIDSRDRKVDSAQLIEATTAMMSDALAAAAGPPGPARQLVVEVVVHDVALHGPVWFATTRFRATLMEGQRAVQTWEARAEQRRSNFLPVDARIAAQEAYRRGLATLVGRLEQWPP